MKQRNLADQIPTFYLKYVINNFPIIFSSFPNAAGSDGAAAANAVPATVADADFANAGRVAIGHETFDSRR